MNLSALQRLREVRLDQLVDDFRQMDPNDPGLWPLGPRIVVLLGILLLVLGGAWYFDWSNQNELLGQKKQEETQLKEEWLGKKRQAVNLEDYRKQLQDIDRQFGALLKQLPNRTEMDNLLVDVNQAGLGRGLQFEFWKPGSEQVRDFYAEVPVAITVNGGYHDIGNFVGDVAKLSRIVTLNDIALEVDSKGSGLKMNATAVTYRYLDSDEVAQQSKNAKSAKNAKGAK